MRHMKELFYFSQSDLMIQVQYGQGSGSFNYSSHREITEGERKFIEHYIRTKVYSDNDEPQLSYMGINENLAKDLNEYHAKNSLKTLHEKHEKIDGEVKGLIKESMSNYYFEQIGNKLVEIRAMFEESALDKELHSLKKDLAELVYAYNIYANRKVSFQNVMPKELISV